MIDQRQSQVGLIRSSMGYRLRPVEPRIERSVYSKSRPTLYVSRLTTTRRLAFSYPFVVANTALGREPKIKSP